MPRQTPASPTPADYFWAAPPFSRTVTALALVVSLLVYGGLLHAFWVVFIPSYLLAIPPQIWRLFSSFLLTGPKFGILYDPYFLYTYGSKLETSSPRFARPADFYAYLIFIWTAILGLNFVFTGASSFMPAMILAFTYTSCIDDRLGKAHFFIVTIPAPWIPLSMILLTMVMDGPYSAMIQTTGLVAAHLHYFLTEIWPTFGGGTNYIRTPAFIGRLFATTVPQVINRAYGTAIRRPDQPTSGDSRGSSTGASSAVLPESWRSRGAGHRLGGE